MIEQIFKLLAGKLTPLGWIKIIASVVALVIALGAGTWVAYKVHQVFTTYQAGKTAKVEIAKKNIVIADQTHQAEQRDESKKVEDVLIIKHDEKVKKIQTQKIKRIAEVKVKEEAIQQDTTKTVEQKKVETAQVYIDSLWDAYCDASGGTNGDCPAPAKTT